MAIIYNSDKIREVETVNVNIRIENTKTKALVDSGSVCITINRSLANAVVLNIQESFWVESRENHEPKTFSNELNKTIGVIKTSEKFNDWAALNVNDTVGEDGHRPIIGRDIFSQLGLTLTQTKQVSNVDQNQSLKKRQIAFVFLGLSSQIGKSFKHTV